MGHRNAKVKSLALTIPILRLTTSTLVGLLAWLFPFSNGEQAMFARMGSGSFGMVVTVCILAPVLEEMLFRGIILRSFLRQHSRWSSIIGSAALFGFAHMNLYQYVVAVIMGIFLGWLYERSKSLLPCIALHAAYNLACTMLGFSGIKDSEGNFGMFSPFSWVVALLLGASVCSCFGVSCFYRQVAGISPRPRFDDESALARSVNIY